MIYRKAQESYRYYGKALVPSYRRSYKKKKRKEKREGKKRYTKSSLLVIHPFNQAIEGVTALDEVVTSTALGLAYGMEKQWSSTGFS